MTHKQPQRRKPGIWQTPGQAIAGCLGAVIATAGLIVFVATIAWLTIKLLTRAWVG